MHSANEAEAALLALVAAGPRIAKTVLTVAKRSRGGDMVDFIVRWHRGEDVQRFAKDGEEVTKCEAPQRTRRGEQAEWAGERSDEHEEKDVDL